MNNDRDLFWELAGRTGVALLLFGLGWLLLTRASGGWAATPQLLLGISFFVAAAIVIAPPLARLLAEPSGSLFYPRVNGSRVTSMYSIPEANRKKGLTQAAFDGFHSIAEGDPQDLRAYIEMMDLAVIDMKNPALATSIFQHGMATLKDEKARASLVTMHKAITSRATSPTPPHRAIKLHSKPGTPA